MKNLPLFSSLLEVPGMESSGNLWEKYSQVIPISTLYCQGGRTRQTVPGMPGVLGGGEKGISLAPTPLANNKVDIPLALSDKTIVILDEDLARIVKRAREIATENVERVDPSMRDRLMSNINHENLPVVTAQYLAGWATVDYDAMRELFPQDDPVTGSSSHVLKRKSLKSRTGNDGVTILLSGHLIADALKGVVRKATAATARGVMGIYAEKLEAADNFLEVGGGSIYFLNIATEKDVDFFARMMVAVSALWNASLFYHAPGQLLRSTTLLNDIGFKLEDPGINPFLPGRLPFNRHAANLAFSEASTSPVIKDKVRGFLFSQKEVEEASEKNARRALSLMFAMTTNRDLTLQISQEFQTESGPSSRGVDFHSVDVAFKSANRVQVFTNDNWMFI